MGSGFGAGALRAFVRSHWEEPEKAARFPPLAFRYRGALAWFGTCPAFRGGRAALVATEVGPNVMAPKSELVRTRSGNSQEGLRWTPRSLTSPVPAPPKACHSEES